MQTKIFSLFALATLAAALPQGGNSSNRCENNGGTVSCCSGIADGLAIECVDIRLVLGGQCSPQQTLACCSTDDVDQDGLVNVVVPVCVPITV